MHPTVDTAPAPRHRERPLFIVGAPRSGTTYLATLLDSHHRLRVGQELWVLRVRDEIRDVLANRATIGFGSQGARLWAEGVSAAMIDTLIRFEQRRTGKARFGDKKPAYARKLPELLAAFPDAQIVHVIRDGRDVAASMIDRQKADPHWRGKRWAPHTWADAGRQWVEFTTEARDVGATLRPDQYHEIRYEDLAAEPAATGVALLDFLNEAADSGFSKALAAFNPRSRGWAAKLRPGQLAELAAVPGFEPLLAELGYPATPVEAGEAALTAAARSGLAEQRLAAGDAEGARAILEEGLAAGLDDPLLHSDLGVLAHLRGDDDEAARLLLHAVRDPAPPLAAVENLLALAHHDNAVHAVPVAAALGAPAKAAVFGWLMARGLDPAAADAVAEALAR